MFNCHGTIASMTLNIKATLSMFQINDQNTLLLIFLCEGIKINYLFYLRDYFPLIRFSVLFDLDLTIDLSSIGHIFVVTI